MTVFEHFDGQGYVNEINVVERRFPGLCKFLQVALELTYTLQGIYLG
jgi:hypothetical protein